MREGEIRCCSECGQPIPRERGKLAFTCSPRCRRVRDGRLSRERMGTAPGQGSPSPSPRGAPPTTCHSTPQQTGKYALSSGNGKRRPPAEPEPPADPLPINDPTAILRRRLLAEAEALLSLPHVEAVTISVRAGTVTSLRSTWDVEDCGDHYEAAQVQAAGVYGERHGYHANQGADLDFGGAP